MPFVPPSVAPTRMPVVPVMPFMPPVSPIDPRHGMHVFGRDVALIDPCSWSLAELFLDFFNTNLELLHAIFFRRKRVGIRRRS